MRVFYIFDTFSSSLVTCWYFTRPIKGFGLLHWAWRWLEEPPKLTYFVFHQWDAGDIDISPRKMHSGPQHTRPKSVGVECEINSFPINELLSDLWAEIVCWASRRRVVHLFSRNIRDPSITFNVSLSWFIKLFHLFLSLSYLLSGWKHSFDSQSIPDKYVGVLTPLRNQKLCIISSCYPSHSAHTRYNYCNIFFSPTSLSLCFDSSTSSLFISYLFLRKSPFIKQYFSDISELYICAL